MTGRGIDQVLPHPNDPRLHEPYIGEARSYVELAESVNGAIPRPVESDYIWGDALAELDRAGVDLRIVNLETSITSSEDYWRDKEIHYRMHPRNIDCITAARIDCCCLANNHVLDWGYDGLAEHCARSTQRASPTRARGATPWRLLLRRCSMCREKAACCFSYGSPTSGVPREWAATAHRPGVNFLEDLRRNRRIAGEMRGFNRQCKVIVASIHWGYRTRDKETRFAHQLIEHGIAVVHGHSSHHVKTAEIHSDRLVLYGCGDFLNDYEGISGYEVFRSDLTLMYLPAIDPRRGQLVEARLVPMRVARFRLNRGAEADAEWLCGLLNQLGAPLGTRGALAPDHTLTLHPFT